MVRKGKLAIFEGSSISETEKVTPTKIGVDTFIAHGPKGKFGRF